MTGRVVVTGGAGYLGSVLTRRLLERGRAVTVLDDLTFGDVGLRDLHDHPGLEVVVGDIRDPEAVRHAFAGADGGAVVHLAAVANDPSGELDPAHTRSVNLHAYPLLLDEAERAGAERFLNASSFSVYGYDETPGITEDHPQHPTKEYSICKSLAEPLVAERDRAGFTTVSLRCATICGWSPRLRLDLVANALVAVAAARGRVVVEGGEQQRPHIHVEDLCDLWLLLLEADPTVVGGETFNALGQNVSIAELAALAREVVGPHVELELRPRRADERSYQVSGDKAARVLGWRAGRPLRDALQDIVDARAAGGWSDVDDPIHHNLRRMQAIGVGGPS